MKPTYWSSIAASPPELASRLIDILGLRLAAAAIGVSDTRTVKQWSDGTRKVSAPKMLQRMRVVSHLVDILTENATYAETRVWFEFYLPDLGYQTPLQILDDKPLDEAAPILLEIAASSTAAPSPAVEQAPESSEAL